MARGTSTSIDPQGFDLFFYKIKGLRKGETEVFFEETKRDKDGHYVASEERTFTIINMRAIHITASSLTLLTKAPRRSTFSL